MKKNPSSRLFGTTLSTAKPPVGSNWQLSTLFVAGKRFTDPESDDCDTIAVGSDNTNVVPANPSFTQLR